MQLQLSAAIGIGHEPEPIDPEVETRRVELKRSNLSWTENPDDPCPSPATCFLRQPLIDGLAQNELHICKIARTAKLGCWCRCFSHNQRSLRTCRKYADDKKRSPDVGNSDDLRFHGHGILRINGSLTGVIRRAINEDRSLYRSRFDRPLTSSLQCKGSLARSQRMFRRIHAGRQYPLRITTSTRT
jgi:hypothetical protein